MVDEKFLENKLIEPKAKDKKRKGEKNLKKNVDNVDEIKNGMIRKESRKEETHNETSQFNDLFNDENGEIKKRPADHHESVSSCKDEHISHKAESEGGKNLEDENLNKIVSRILDAISLQVYLFYTPIIFYIFFFFLN
jgi:hypothetical protein